MPIDEAFGIEARIPPALQSWNVINERVRNPEGAVTIAIVGKYTGMKDAYKSLIEALAHGGIANGVKVNLDWIDSEVFEREDAAPMLEHVHGILVPGGFGVRGTEDLGGGIKAFFQCESSAPPDAGGGTFCSRNSGVGLQGNFGSVLLGRWDSPFKLSQIFVDPYGQNTLGNQQTWVGVSGAGGNNDFNRRQNNNIQYWSPVFSGFSVRLNYGAKSIPERARSLALASHVRQPIRRRAKVQPRCLRSSLPRSRFARWRLAANGRLRRSQTGHRHPERGAAPRSCRPGRRTKC